MEVFIIEECSAVREEIFTIFSRMKGVDITFSGCEKDFTPYLQRLKPDIVIMGADICDCDSIEILRLIKDEFPGVVVMVLSDFLSPEYRTLWTDFGADYFFDKRCELDEMAGAVLLMKYNGSISESAECLIC